MANQSVDPGVLREFVSAVKDATASKRTTKEYLSGVVTHTDVDGTVWVNVAGGVNDMPVTRSTASYSPGDIVSFTIENGVASMGGNITDPAASGDQVVHVTKNVEVIETKVEHIGRIVAEKADIQDLKAANAEIEQLQAADATITGKLTAAEGNIADLQAKDAEIEGTLTAANADIDNLKAKDVEIEGNISAATGRIGNLESDNVSVKGRLDAAEADIDDLEAEDARITNLVAGKASITDLDAATGRISDLESDHVSTDDLDATNARIGTVEADYLKAADMQAESARVDTLLAKKATVNDLNAAVGRITTLESTKANISDIEANYITADDIDAKYMHANMSNSDVAWIQNGVIANGAISSAMINDVSANKLTAGTINGSVINVTNLNADNITTGTINGQRIGEGSLGLDKLSEDVYTEAEVDAKLSSMQAEIDGAIETWTGTEVPTLNNAPASGWTTTADRDKHVGDVYFVVNSQSQQNGYNYRFTKTGSAYSWQLIKDNDVTNALQRLETAEGKITQFDSDISTLKTDTGTLTTRTTSLETRADGVDSALLDKVDTTDFNELSDTVDGHTQTLSQHTTAISNKADGSTVTALTTRVSKNEQDISGINTTIGELQTTVASKADGSELTTVSNKLNTVSDTVDGHTQTISSVQSTLETKADSSTVSTLTTRVSDVEQDVSGFKQTVSETYATKSEAKQTDSDSGKREIATEDAAELPLLSLTAYGECEQDGTPAPDAPVPIKAVAPVNLAGMGNSIDDWRVTAAYKVNKFEDGRLYFNVQNSGLTYGWRLKNLPGNRIYEVSACCEHPSLSLMIRLRNSDDTGWLTSSDVTIDNWTYNSVYGGWHRRSDAKTVIFALIVPECLYCQVGVLIHNNNGASTAATPVLYVENLQVVEGYHAHPFVKPGCIGIYSHSKNWFDPDRLDGSPGWSDGVFSGTPSTLYGQRFWVLSQDYPSVATISFDFRYTAETVTPSSSNGLSVQFVYTDSTYKSYYTRRVTESTRFSFTSDSTKVLWRVHFGYVLNAACEIKNIQIEPGTTATEYEPHSVKSASYIDLQGHELCSLPDGTQDVLTVDASGHVEIEKPVAHTTQATTDGVTATVGVDAWSTTGDLSDGADVYYPAAEPQTIDLGYIDPPTTFDGGSVRVIAEIQPVIDASWWTKAGYEAGKAFVEGNTSADLSALEQRVTTAETSITQQAGQIQSKASQTEVNALSGRVSTAESTITQQAGQIEAKVSKDGVIAAINLSAEEEGGSAARISADKVNIEGAAIFTSGRLSQSSLDGAYDAKNAASTALSDAEEYVDGKGYQTASDVSTAVANGTANLAAKADAIARSQRIWYRQTADGAKPGKNLTWLSTSGTGYGNWSLTVPQMTNGSTKYPKLYTAVQSQTVAQQAAGTACSCSDVQLDDSTTVIDGGNIITGSVAANKLEVYDATIQKIRADAIDTNSITIGQGQVTGLTTALDGKQPTGDYATNAQAQGYADAKDAAIANAAKRTYVSIRATAIDYTADTATLEATLYVDGTATTSGVTYAWLIDGTAISGATSRTYSVPASSGLDHAYSCKVTY